MRDLAQAMSGSRPSNPADLVLEFHDPLLPTVVTAAACVIVTVSVVREVQDDGSEWYLIGFERNGRDGMAVSCTPKDKRADNAAYAFAVVDGFNARAQTGNIIVIAGTVLGFALAIWTFIARRRRTHQEPDDASA